MFSGIFFRLEKLLPKHVSKLRGGTIWIEAISFSCYCYGTIFSLNTFINAFLVGHNVLHRNKKYIKK